MDYLSSFNLNDGAGTGRGVEKPDQIAQILLRVKTLKYNVGEKPQGKHKSYLELKTNASLFTVAMTQIHLVETNPTHTLQNTGELK